MDELELHPAERDEIPASDVGLDLAPALRTGVGAAFLDGSSTLAEIAFDISDVLGVDRERVEADVLDLVRTLGAQGLLEGVARDEHAGHDHARQPQGVPVGADLGGWDRWSELAVEPTLVVNWGTRCGFCSTIVSDLDALRPRLREAGVSLLLVTTGSQESFREQTGEADLPVLHVEEVPDFFTGLGTPVAYLVDADRSVAQAIAVGSGEVPDLARRLAGEG